MGKTCDRNNFDRDTIVGAGWLVVSAPQKQLPAFLHTREFTQNGAIKKEFNTL